MGKRIRFVAACAMALGVVTSAVLLGTATVGAGAQGEGVIRAVQRSNDVRSAFLDFDHDGTIDRGDRFASRGPLLAPATGERIGLANWDCVTMTRVARPELQRGKFVCTTLLQLANGAITLQGPDPAGFGASVFAVTGGTGLYRTARGQASVVDAPDPDRTVITIHLEP
jgi:hypothetical protein